MKNYFLEFQSLISDWAKKIVHTEISNFGFKILLGFFITCMMVFSMIQVALAYLIWLSQFKYELYMKLISFSMLSVIGIIALYYLFKNDKTPPLKEMPSNAFDLNQLVINFGSGLIEGYQSVQLEKKSNTANSI